MSTWVAFSGAATLQPEGSAGTGVASTTFVTSTWTVSLTTFSTSTCWVTTFSTCWVTTFSTT